MQSKIVSGYEGVQKISELREEKRDCIAKCIYFYTSQLFTDFNVLKLKFESP
jgi:hypothetical protein